MRKGDRVELNMLKVLCVGQKQDDRVYIGEVLKYDDNEECLYILLQDGTLRDISLDAVYKCEIHTETERICCTGRVRERYNGEAGKMLKLEIDNGFYKINLK